MANNEQTDGAQAYTLIYDAIYNTDEEYKVAEATQLNPNIVNNYNTFMEAVRRGNQKCVLKMVENGFSPNYFDTSPALIVAVINRRIDIIKILCDHGASINSVNATKNTPLLYCILDHKNNGGKLGAYFIERGADYTIEDCEGKTSLDNIVSYGDVTTLEAILATYKYFMNDPLAINMLHKVTQLEHPTEHQSNIRELLEVAKKNLIGQYTKSADKKR